MRVVPPRNVVGFGCEAGPSRNWCICIYRATESNWLDAVVEQGVVIDEWGYVRRGMAALLTEAGVRVVAQAATATEGFAALKAETVDVIVIGCLPDSTVLEAVRRASADRQLGIVAVVPVVDRSAIIDLCSAGAHAVLARSSSESDLADAVAHARRGERYIGRDLLAAIFPGPRHRSPTSVGRFKLTEREQAVLAQLVAGGTNREIADALCIGTETVKTHLVSIYAKLDVQRRDQAVGVALQGGLV